MPYKSKAQAAYFNIHRKELEKQGVDVDEWNSATKGKHLPEHTMKHPHHGFDKTTIKHHHDGSHTITHHHHADPEKTVQHAVPDLEGAKQSLEDHLGAGEAAAPPAAAPPAAAPAPAPMAPPAGAM